MELENKKGEKFVIDEEKFIELQAATLMLGESFIDSEDTVDSFIERADTLVPTPKRFNRTTESTTLGNAIFVGIGKYGIDFIDKILLADTAKYSVHALFDYTMNLIDVLNMIGSTEPESETEK